MVILEPKLVHAEHHHLPLLDVAQEGGEARLV